MSEIHGATGSYVVNALDPDELDEFEAHLAVCPTCRQEVVEFCETAAELSLLAAAPPPPPALRASVLAGIAGVRQLPPVPGNPRRAIASDEEPEDEPLSAAVRAEDHEDRVVDELAARRANRRTRLLTVLVAAVAVVALALGGTVWGLVRQQQQPAAAGPSADTSLLAAPDAKLVKTTVNGTAVSFIVSKAQNRALFVGGDLPSPGIDKTFQLWTLRGQAATPDNLLPGGTNVAQWFHGPITGSDGLAISIEPAGGSTQPTNVVGAVKI